MRATDLNDIRLFVQVARAGSFALAARQLGLPVNTLSRRIRRLELRMQARLLHRSTRKLALTAAGESLLARSAGAVDVLLHAAQDLAEDSRGIRGRIRVAAPAGFLELVRLEWIAEFLAAHPALNLEFVLEDERTDLIGSGIDVALRAGPVPGATHTVLQTLVQQDSRLFASPDYLARRGTPRRVADLAAHDCLIASRRGDRQIWTLEGPNGAEEVGVQGRFAANNAQVLRQAAVAGLGIALLPVLLTAADRVEGRLREVLPRHGRGGTDLRVVVPIGPLVPPAVRVFVAFVEEKLGAALDAIG